MVRLTTSDAGLALIASFEGFQAESTPLGDGRWIVGHGHASPASGPMRLTRREARALLRHDLAPIEAFLNTRTFAPVSQNQFDALASFAYNIGLDAFRTSDVLAAMTRGEPVVAAMALTGWQYSQLHGRTQIVDALVRRRAAEAALFLTPDTANPPVAPTPLLAPLSTARRDTAHVHVWDNASEAAPAAPVPDREADVLPPVVATPVPESPSAPVAAGNNHSPQEAAAEAIGRKVEELFAPAPLPKGAGDGGPEGIEPEPSRTGGDTEGTPPSPPAFPLDGAMDDAPAPNTGVMATDAEPDVAIAVPVQGQAPLVAPVPIKPSGEVAAVTPPSRVAQAVIIVAGIALLLWANIEGAFSGAAANGHPTGVLLGIAGACFIAVGGYFLLRPPVED